MGLAGNALDSATFYRPGDIENPQTLTVYLTGDSVGNSAEFYCRGFDTCDFYYYGDEFFPSVYGCGLYTFNPNFTANATCNFYQNDYSWIDVNFTYPPTNMPSTIPTSEPTDRPSVSPTTGEPTASPTENPTEVSTEEIFGR